MKLVDSAKAGLKSHLKSAAYRFHWRPGSGSPGDSLRLDDDRLCAELLFPLANGGAHRHAPGRVELACSIHDGIDFDADLHNLAAHPIAAWLERAIAWGGPANGYSPVAMPRRIADLGEQLAGASGKDVDSCCRYLQEFLQWTLAVRSESKGARRLSVPPRIEASHFVSVNGAIYAALESPAGTRGSDGECRPLADAPLFRVAFSRASGEPLLCVTLVDKQLQPRNYGDYSADEMGAVDGYLIVDEALWCPEDDYELMPEAWMVDSGDGPMPRARYERRFPQLLSFDDEGALSEEHRFDSAGWFISSPLLFDPTCWNPWMQAASG